MFGSVRVAHEIVYRAYRTVASIASQLRLLSGVFRAPEAKSLTHYRRYTVPLPPNASCAFIGQSQLRLGMARGCPETIHVTVGGWLQIEAQAFPTDGVPDMRSCPIYFI